MKIVLNIFVLLFALSSLQAQNQVKWYTIEEAFKLSAEEPRKMMIDVYTDWCSWCKVMDNSTFNNEHIAEYLNSNYYPVKFNAEQKEDVNIDGVTYKFVNEGSRGYHQLAAALLNGQLAYPSTVFLDEEKKMLQPVQGYIKAPQFDEIIRFFGNDNYKNQTWAEFQSTYQSPIADNE